MKDESAGWLGALVVIGVFLVVGGRVKCVISGVLGGFSLGMTKVK